MAQQVPSYLIDADPLGEVFHFLRMTGVFYTHSTMRAPWGLSLPAMPDCMILHLVTAGSCVVQTDADTIYRVNPGDLLLVPHGTGHAMADDVTSECVNLFDIHREQVSERYELLRHGGDGALTQMICAGVCFQHPNASHLLDVLPPIIRLQAEADREDRGLSALLEMMAHEARTLKPGGEAILTRLADVLVIKVIRSWIEQAKGNHKGWLAALQDPLIGRSLLQIHREPQRDWTVASMAEMAGMSRSAFAARFTEMVGETAMHYVTRWRMNLALARLRTEDVGLADLAEDLGYGSEAAFSRAFKRFNGISPGAARKLGHAAS